MSYMPVIAVTGGFGTGKTTVARMFHELGAQIVDVDFIAFDLERPDQLAWKKIVNAFGEKVLKEDGKLDRPMLASIVFSDSKQLKKLNSLVHPLILERMREEIQKLLEIDSNALVVVDIPLLFEVHQQKSFEKIVVVKADDSIVLERIMLNRKLSAVEINQRIQSQIPLEKKVKEADFVVDNNNGLEKTKEQAQGIFNSLTVFPKADTNNFKHQKP